MLRIICFLLLFSLGCNPHGEPESQEVKLKRYQANYDSTISELKQMGITNIPFFQSLEGSLLQIQGEIEVGQPSRDSIFIWDWDKKDWAIEYFNN